MRKRFLSGMGLLLATLLCVGLTACSGNDNRQPINAGNKDGKDDKTEQATDTGIGDTENSGEIVASGTDQNGDSNATQNTDDQNVTNGDTADGKLAGTCWRTEDYGNPETKSVELIFFEDGTFIHREPRYHENGIPDYETLYASENSWKVEGDIITLHTKAGYAEEGSHDDEYDYELSYKDGKITMKDPIYDSDYVIELFPAEMPKIESQEDAPKMVGKWKVIASSMEGWVEIYDEPDPYYNRTIEITEKDGKYFFNYEETLDGEVFTTLSDLEMTLQDEPLYEGFKNCFWSAEIADAPDDDNWRLATLYDDNILTYVVSNYGTDSGSDYTFISYTYFVRDDENAKKNTEAFFSPRAVTVSDIHQLVKEVRNGTNITLKGGKYNFSELDESEATMYVQCQDLGGGELEWSFRASNLTLSAAENEDVTIVVEDPYLDVLQLSYCENVRINGITMGHEVFETSCGCPVIHTYYARNVYINDCRLYGSGTYGIYADSSVNVRATGTEIYDCTTGAVFMDEYSSLTLDDCYIHDNYNGYGGLFYGCEYSGITVKNSTIKDNSSASSSLVKLTEYSTATFENCTFENNLFVFEDSYDDPSNLNFENCTFKDE